MRADTRVLWAGLVAVVVGGPSASRAADSPEPTACDDVRALASVVLEDHTRVAFDESRLDPSSRASVIRALVSLARCGIVVEGVEAHAATFCTAPSRGRTALLPDGRPARACRSVAPEYTVALGARMADEAARLVTEATGATHVERVSYGDEKPLVSYPDRNRSSAGDWNAAARANNRLVFVFREAPAKRP